MPIPDPESASGLSSYELSRMACRWAETDALYLHLAMCLLAGEWRTCLHCAPLMSELEPAVKSYVRNRERRKKRAAASAKR